jgi:hypothetical protein
MAQPQRAKVDLDAYTGTLPATAQLKGYVPAPIVTRADQLYDLLLRRARASRGDLLAALVQAAPEEPDALADLVKAYQDVQVWQTLVGEKRKKGSTALPARRQGRPARRGG